MSVETPEAPKNDLRILIAVAAHDQVSAGFAHDLAMLIGQSGYNRPDIELRLSFNKGTILSALREGLVMDAVDRDATHICFIDSDMRFPANAVIQLLSHGQPATGVNYVTRRFPLKPTAYVKEDEVLWTEPDSNGLVEVVRMGLGLALFDMDIFRFIPQPWFPIEFKTKEIGDRRFNYYLTEDYALCDKIRTAGVRVLVDQDLSQHIRHEGSWEFSHDHALAQRDAIQYAEATNAGDQHHGLHDSESVPSVVASQE